MRILWPEAIPMSLVPMSYVPLTGTDKVLVVGYDDEGERFMGLEVLDEELYFWLADSDAAELTEDEFIDKYIGSRQEEFRRFLEEAKNGVKRKRRSKKDDNE